MNLEYCPNGLGNGSLVLLYEIDPIAASCLKEHISALAAKRIGRFAVRELPGFLAVDECRLFCSVTKRDSGVVQLEEPNTFECRLQPSSWDNIEGLLEPFTKKDLSDGFQWLDRGNIALMISARREW